MKSVRVLFAVVALLALPFGSAAAQRASKGQVRSSEVGTDCKDQQAASLGRAADAGRESPYGLDKKCQPPVTPPPPPPPPANPPPPPPPPSNEPPTGIHEARGVVYEDVDGNGSRDVFAGEMGLAGWTINLYWDGQFVSSTTSDADGNYVFTNIGNSTKPWSICVIPQAGYSRTQPVSGNACSGDGMVHFVDSPFMNWLQTDFGEMIQ